MKRILRIPAIVLLLTGSALLAQNTSPSTANPDSTAPAAPAATTQQPAQPQASAPTGSAEQPHIAPGSVIPVQLTKTLDAKKVKAGDEVVAKVTQDMKTGSGEVLVPKDTKVIGHVTEAQVRNKEQKESQLAIAFNQAVLKNEPVQLPMSIQAVIGQEPNNATNAYGSPGGEPTQPSGSGTGAPSAGRSPMAGNAGQQQAPRSTPSGDTDTSQPGAKLPPINGNTQGVVGISNLSLSPNSNATHGSVLSSEKNNVKLESGTLLLLRVNQ